jgi:hypothetical protein
VAPDIFTQDFMTMLANYGKEIVTSTSSVLDSSSYAGTSASILSGVSSSGVDVVPVTKAGYNGELNTYTNSEVHNQTITINTVNIEEADNIEGLIESINQYVVTADPNLKTE